MSTEQHQAEAIDDAPAGDAALFCLVDPSLKDFVGHHFEYDRAVTEGARAEGFEVRVLAHRDVSAAIAEQLPVQRSFLYDIWGEPAGDGDAAAGELRANDAFLEALNAGVRDLRLDRRSIVFGHMITARQLLGWARFARERLGPDGPTIVLLLRYQPAFYQSAAAAEAFRMLEAAAGTGRLRLSSDSARLSHQLERLTSLPVEVWPLPHTTELKPEPPKAPIAGRPLRIVSMGNARDEKGILELFNAARILDAYGEGKRFRFVLQVNDPTPALKPAIDAFAAEQRPNVELVWQPLSTEGYFDLLKSADVVAVPYWREIYTARTSGIFLEAVAAGKPVICTDDTWMSDQLKLAGAGIAIEDRDDSALAAALIRIADEYESFAARARETSRRWLEIHNPASFMRALLHGGQAPTAAPNRPTAAILYPWGDAPQNAAGAALRVNLMARFLAERCAEVRLLGDGDYANQRRGRIVQESFPITEAIQRTFAYRWISRFARYLLRARKGEEIYLLLMLLPRFSRSFQGRIDEIVRNSDLILLDYPFWAPLVAKACRRHGKTFVLTAHDVIADQVRYSIPLRWLTALAERASMALAPHRLAVTEADAAKFARWGLPCRISMNTVDVEASARRLPVDTRALLLKLTDLPADAGPLFLFVGSRFGPNIAAAAVVRGVARDLNTRRPELRAHVVVVGGCMEPVREPGFAALGRVDDLTLKLLYEHCAGVVIPLTIGTGMSLKTIEALAGGHVVVGTAKAFRGLPPAERPAWVQEDNLGAYTDRLIRLIEDPAGSAELRTNIAAYRSELDFRAAFEPYLSIFGALRTVEPDPITADDRYIAYVLSAATAARDRGLGELALTLTRNLVGQFPNSGSAALLFAELSSATGASAVRKALDVALRDGVDAVKVLRARARRMPNAKRAAMTEAAALIEANRAWTVQGDLDLRARLWSGFHADERVWVNQVATATDRLQPDLPACDYAYLRARTAVSDGAADEAIDRARAAVDKGFDVYWGSMLLGELLARAGRDDEAVAAYLRASSATDDPGRIDMAEHQAAEPAFKLLSAGETARAKDLAGRYLRLWPHNGHLKFALAEALKVLGEDLVLACELYRDAAGRYPLASRAHMACAEIMAWIGEPESAAAQARSAIERARDDTERLAMQRRAAASSPVPV